MNSMAIMKPFLFYPESMLISLSEELIMVKNYIELQKREKSEKVSLTYHIIGECNAYKIEPLLFFPILENAFKYGVDNVKESFIDIVLIILETKLQFKVTNRVFPFCNSNRPESGKGLYNLKRRLELFYPDRHHFKIEETKEIFTVSMIIQLEE